MATKARPTKAAKPRAKQEAGRARPETSRTIGDIVKVRVSGEVMTLPVSTLANQSLQVVESMGPTTEAIVTNNNKTMGVFMTVERRNALAEAEELLEETRAQLDMMAANRTLSDIQRSAEEVRQRKGMSLDDLREKLKAEVAKG